MNMLNGALYPMRAFSGGSPIASQALVVSTAAVGFTTNPYVATPGVDGISVVSFDIQDNDVRCRFDGNDPTSTVGHILPASTAYTWTASQFLAAKFIRISTATADANIFASPFMIS